MDTGALTDLINSLLRASSENKKVTEKLLEDLEVIESFIFSVIKSGAFDDDYERFDFKLKSGKILGVRHISSNAGGSNYVCIFVPDEQLESVEYDRYMLPNGIGKLYTKDYLHGDYGTLVHYMARTHVLEFAENVTSFIQHITKVMDELTEKQKEAQKKVDNVITDIK